MTEIKEIKKKGRPSKQDNILTKNAFEKKEEPLVPIVEEKKEAEVKEVPLTAPNTPVQTPIVPIDMPKPKKERSVAQIEATKKMLEANKLKKGSKKEIIIKEEAIPEAKENLKVALKNIIPAPVVKDVLQSKTNQSKAERYPTPVPVKKAPKEEKKKEKKVKKPVKYETSSEEESESSSEEYIQKFEKKAARKIQVVNSIEERLRQNAIPRNKYSNLSIFS